MSLRARLTLLVAGVVAAAVMAGAFATRASAEAELAAETDRFLRDRAGRIARGEGGPVPGLTGSRPGPGGGRGRLFGLDAVTQIISAGGSTEPLF
ncbi:MAG: hypothetical protein ACRD0M_09980, partial [Acidimicrobiales bacterium]